MDGKAWPWDPGDRTGTFVDPRTPPPGRGPIGRGGAARPWSEALKLWSGGQASEEAKRLAVRRRSARVQSVLVGGESERAFIGFRIARDP